MEQLHKANLANITSPNQMLDYIVKTGDILISYCNGDNQNKLKHQYLMLTDINYKMKHLKSSFNVTCNKCNLRRLYNEYEGRYVCPNCGETEYILTHVLNYKDWQTIKRYTPYKKISHLKERLNQLQAKEGKHVPNEIISLIKSEMTVRKIDCNQCTIEQIRSIMNIKHLQKYYNNIQQIYCAITRRQPIVLSQETEQIVIEMFKQVESVFKRLYPNRRNFLNYSYILNKLFHIVHMPHIAKYFPLIKINERLIRYDDIFENICTILKWKFYPS